MYSYLLSLTSPPWWPCHTAINNPNHRDTGTHHSLCNHQTEASVHPWPDTGPGFACFDFPFLSQRTPPSPMLLFGAAALPPQLAAFIPCMTRKTKQILVIIHMIAHHTNADLMAYSWTHALPPHPLNTACPHPSQPRLPPPSSSSLSPSLPPAGSPLRLQVKSPSSTYGRETKRGPEKRSQ